MGTAGVKTTPELGGILGAAVRTVAGVAMRLRRKAAIFALVTLTMPIGYKAVCGTHGYLAYRDEVNESHKLDAEIADLKQRNAKVQQDITGLKTDPKVIEREAREQLRYVRPDDIVITIPQAQAQAERQARALPAPRRH